MDVATRDLVRQRASDPCEYCGLARDDAPFAAFHIEHIIPKKHGGSDDASNLALACYHCNLHKGPNLTGIDPDSGAIAPLFHPRRETWDEHFVRQGLLIVGLTPTGRATVRVLMMNAVGRLELRSELE
jgi:5-methylcytosine-specific restriction endonuclease McrA